MKNRSIRQMILYMIGLIVAMLLMFYFLSAYSNYQTMNEFNEIVSFQLAYDSYENKIDTLQDCVTAYFNQSEKIEASDIETLCREFQDSSEELADYFLHPQFTDNQYVVNTYIEAVETFLERGRGVSIAEQFELYNETMRLYRMALDSYSTTSSFEEEIITQKMHASSAAWHRKENTIFVLGILICIFALWRARKFVDRISQPIIALTDRAHQIREKNYEKMEESAQQREVCRETVLLSKAFDEMSQTIRRQMEELQEKIVVSQRLYKLEMENMQTKVSLNQTQMCLMQSLISPHFLFNCLSTLTSLAFIEEAHRTEECSIQLAKFLRKFLDHIGKTVTIEEEVGHISEYIQIQKLRFGKRITFLVECEEGCREKKIPAIVLQPLVENALSHGLKNCRQNGLIQVKIYRKETSIILEVRDNGEGISEEKIIQIESELEKPFESSEKGIGLRSVAYRIRDFFGEDAGVQLESLESGTAVKINIPAA